MLAERGDLSVLDLRGELVWSAADVDPILAHGACWQEDGACIFTVGAHHEQQLKLWDTRRKGDAPVFVGNNRATNDPLTAVACRSIDQVFTGTERGHIVAWDLRGVSVGTSGTSLAAFPGECWSPHVGEVRCLAAHPADKSIVVTGGEDGRVTICGSVRDWGSQEKLFVDQLRPEGPSSVSALAFDLETNFIAAACDDESIMLHSRNSRLEVGSRFAS